MATRSACYCTGKAVIILSYSLRKDAMGSITAPPIATRLRSCRSWQGYNRTQRSPACSIVWANVPPMVIPGRQAALAHSEGNTALQPTARAIDAHVVSYCWKKQQLHSMSAVRAQCVLSIRSCYPLHTRVSVLLG